MLDRWNEGSALTWLFQNFIYKTNFPFTHDIIFHLHIKIDVEMPVLITTCVSGAVKIPAVGLAYLIGMLSEPVCSRIELKGGF